MVSTITNQLAADVFCLYGDFPERDQFQFGNMIIKQLGFDFNRGRQDKTHHPYYDPIFSQRCSNHDQIKSYVGESLFSVIHEAGHAFYELGVN